MTPLPNTLLLEVFAIAAILLSLKALFLGVATAATRGKLKQFINAEDAAWIGGEHVTADAEAAARLGRAQRNDVENLLLFAVVGGLYLAAGASAVAGLIYVGVFFVARVLHTVAYLGARPMLRRNAYTLGFLVVLAMGVHTATGIVLRHVG